MGWFIKAIRLNEITKTISREEKRIKYQELSIIFYSIIICYAKKKKRMRKKKYLLRDHIGDQKIHSVMSCKINEIIHFF